jgi:hypothetical protein
MKIDRITQGAFRKDHPLLSALFHLVRPSYEDPTALLDREVAHCDTLYLARDEAGRLLSFFMVAWETLPLDDRPVPAVYLGLSATSEETKNSGIVYRLYRKFCVDAAAREGETGRRLLLWGTTATPSAFLAVHFLFADVEPRGDGTYSEPGKTTAGQLRRHLKALDPAEGYHPFLLRRVAGNTRYSAREVERIRGVCRKKGFSLFRQMNLDERNGDRVLFLGRTPGGGPGGRTILSETHGVFPCTW